MKAEVVTVSSYTPKQPYYRFGAFKASVRKFGVEPTILGYNDEWHGLMTKPRRYREFLRKGHASGDVLIVCDAWDIFFVEHPDAIAESYWAHWFCDRCKKPPIVFNAERNCFPCTEATKDGFDRGIEERGGLPPDVPWRYLNSGFMIGCPQEILELLESLNLDAIPDDHQLPDGSWFNPNDQDHFQRAFLQQPVPMELDHMARLCIAAHGSTIEEFDWSTPTPKNIATGLEPMVWHCNGSAKNDIAPVLLKHLGLPER